MLKKFFATVILLIASTLLIVQASFASPLLETTQLISEGTPKTQTLTSPKSPEIPVESTQQNQQSTNDEKTEVKQTPTKVSPRLTYPRPPHPYNMEVIEKFNEELYGE